MQEKESIMVFRCELKIPSLVITVREHSASLVVPNSYPRDGIFNLHLTTIKDSYTLTDHRLHMTPRRSDDKIRQVVGLAQQGCNYHFLQKSLFFIF